MPTYSRRSVLFGFGAAVGLASLPRHAFAALDGTPFTFLTDSEARSLALLCDTLIPQDDFPSASQAGVVDFIDLQLAGGYGRGELAPFSDVDLMFLLPYKLTPRSEQLIEHTLYMLWDLGLKVGHATRSLSEALRLAKEDLTIRTSLLEARWLWGNTILFSEFQARFRKEIIEPTKQDFVSAKLAERDDRHVKMDAWIFPPPDFGCHRQCHS